MSSPEHSPKSDPCERCGLPAKRHRKRLRERTVYARKYGRKRHQVRPRRQDRIIGIDGEGQGRRPHLYTYLAAVDENGQEWEVENSKGLHAKQIFDFLLDLPDRSVVFGFALGYDETKWLTDLPNKSIYRLFHEKTRQYIVDGHPRYSPIPWKGYRINYCNKLLSISRHGRSVAIWDIFAFFQSKFTKAISDWKITDPKTIKYLEGMKDKRSKFDRLNSAKVKAYCKLECKNLAKLGRALLKAHQDVGLPLKKFHGAGSSASVFLDKIGAKHLRGEHPEEMRHAIAKAFFGGRFENSWSGPIHGTVFNADISSAYPYQTTFLPCLKHGKWRYASNPSGRDISNANLALCHWSRPRGSTYHKSTGKVAWGLLPVRSELGTIAFPQSAQGGWAWKQEIQVAQKIASVLVSEAWLYNTDCDCQPFKDVPKYYLDRLRLGKEAMGIVIKLALNSIYGKLAQSKGGVPPYQSWIWAGNITSGTRAQLLEALLCVSDPWDILMFATDGIWSRKKLALPKPADTGTDIDVQSKDEDGKPITVRKPLGGWEQKEFKKGVFCVRPGIYFPLQPTTEEIEKVRARGLGRRVLYESWPNVLRAWQNGQDSLWIGGTKKNGDPVLSRFVGAKSSVTKSSSGYKRGDDYGEWIAHEINVGFSPFPKRKSILDDGRMETWPHFNWESVPYDPAMKDPESMALIDATNSGLEQPNGDFAEFDDETN